MGGVKMKLYKDLYTYRELLKTNVKKEIRGKYKGSSLGVLWSFINPLLQVAVYAIVFPHIMKQDIPNFLIFLIIGIIPWTFFSTTIGQGMSTVLANAGIIKKVYFPREILPISVIISGVVNFAISNVIILIFTLFGGIGISWHLIFLPLIMLFQAMFSLGLVFILSAINIYIKDTEYIVNFIINLAFYATPILYTRSMFANNKLIQVVFTLNPMTTFIESYRDIYLYHQIPNLMMLLIMGFVSFLVIFIGYYIFKKLEKGFAEEV